MTARCLLAVLILALAGCAASSSSVRLTPYDATRIADHKARSSVHDLQKYDRPLARYDPGNKSWWVSYQRKNTKFTEFKVRVDDASKEASLILPWWSEQMSGEQGTRSTE